MKRTLTTTVSVQKYQQYFGCSLPIVGFFNLFYHMNYCWGTDQDDISTQRRWDDKEHGKPTMNRKLQVGKYPATETNQSLQHLLCLCGHRRCSLIPLHIFAYSKPANKRPSYYQSSTTEPQRLQLPLNQWTFLPIVSGSFPSADDSPHIHIIGMFQSTMI